jgi:hypothetical protein
MNVLMITIAGLILLPAVGLVTWALFAMARVETQLRDLGGFEGLHFDIGPHTANSTGAT